MLDYREFLKGFSNIPYIFLLTIKELTGFSRFSYLAHIWSCLVSLLTFFYINEFLFGEMVVLIYSIYNLINQYCRMVVDIIFSMKDGKVFKLIFVRYVQ